MLGRVRALRGVDSRRDALIDLADRGHQLRDVVVLGVVRGTAQVPDDVVADLELAHRPDALDDRTVAFLRPHGIRARPLKVPVGVVGPLDGLVLVVVRVDKPWHDDHAPGIHDVSRRLDLRPHHGDLGPLDQHVGLLEVAYRRVHREHDTALDQNAPTARRAAMPAIEIFRQRGARQSGAGNGARGKPSRARLQEATTR
jgi:hypothetical protein